MRAVRAARAKVTVAALPCSRTRRVLKAGAGSPPDAPSRLAVRVVCAYQVSPRQTAAVTSPNAIQPSARSCTSVKPSQNPRPTIANAGWANSSSDRSPGTAAAGVAEAARFAGAAADAVAATVADSVRVAAESVVAESVVAESAAGVVTAGRARPRLLVTSR